MNHPYPRLELLEMFFDTLSRFVAKVNVCMVLGQSYPVIQTICRTGRLRVSTASLSGLSNCQRADAVRCLERVFIASRMKLAKTMLRNCQNMSFADLLIV